ncbi:MAG: alpha/beta hydrolase [Actinomycetota bacterium]|nr:alpha/beta hydrolase [Actinomycetota bacterium]
MTSTTVEIKAKDGLTLLTRRWECEDPQARILLVHGLGEHSGRYEHVGDFLAERRFELFAFDLRGHGASEGIRVDVETFDDYLEDLELVFGEMPSDLPTVIYGHSMGGLIATSYAVSDRPQPSLYVLSAPALDADVPAALKTTAKVLARLRPGMRLPNSIKAEQLSRDPSVGEKYFADPLVMTKGTARFGSALMGQMATIGDELGRLSVPTLVFHGAEDELVPPHASAPLAAVEGVERKLFPGLRHETHNEPEQAEVLGFMAQWLEGQLA